ncbi:MAG: DUF6265 family protein [Pseudomonadota bacterium]
MNPTPMLVLSAAILLAGATAHAAPGDLQKMSWLAGCWQSQDAEPGSVEHWTPIGGATMLGLSRTVRQGQTVAFEFMQLRELPDGRLAFIAQPSGRSPTTFPALRVSDTEVTFENTSHDFPQRVIYARDGHARLRARIEGQRNGTLRAIDFPMLRVGCDAPVASAPPSAPAPSPASAASAPK